MRYVPVRIVTLVLLGSAIVLLPGGRGRVERLEFSMRVPPRRGAIIRRLRLQRVKTYRHNVAVHWGDTDPARIVFYPNYFEWFDQSTRLFFDSVGLDWDSLGKKYGIMGLPIVEDKARFLAPCKFRDEIVIESHVDKWNDKTFEVCHSVLFCFFKQKTAYEIRVWAHRHP